jgi:hypothetical protein
MENEANASYSFSLEYCTRLFKRETIEAIAGHFVKLLDHLVQNPNTMIIDIPISESQAIKKHKEFIGLAEIDF